MFENRLRASRRTSHPAVLLIIGSIVLSSCQPESLTAPEDDRRLTNVLALQPPPPGSEPNKAVQMNGLDALVSLDPKPIGTPASVTVEAWIRLSETGRLQFIVTDATDDFNEGFSLLIDDGNRVLWVVAKSQSDKSFLLGTTALQPEIWYHVAGVYDADNSVSRIYVNGVEDASADYDAGITYSGGPSLLLGAQVKFFNRQGRFFNGAIDEVRIWNFARSGDEIAAEKDFEIEPDLQGLLGYWRLNEGDGTTTADLTSAGEDGVLQGGATWVDATWRQSRLMEVGIDIMPFRKHNRIGRHRRKISVAILSTPDFNAPWDIDRASLTFGVTGDEESLLFKFRHGQRKPRCWSFDVNRDGLRDLFCRFKRAATGLEPGDTEAILKGETMDGVAIIGRDAVVIREHRHRKHH